MAQAPLPEPAAEAPVARMSPPVKKSSPLPAMLMTAVVVGGLAFGGMYYMNQKRLAKPAVEAPPEMEEVTYSLPNQTMNLADGDRHARCAAVLAFLEGVELGFLALLAYFSVTITERMQYQRMTVFDLPMSYVYFGVALGCILMFLRQAQIFWRNARIGWRRPHEMHSQVAAD